MESVHLSLVVQQGRVESGLRSREGGVRFFVLVSLFFSRGRSLLQSSRVRSRLPAPPFLPPKFILVPTHVSPDRTGSHRLIFFLCFIVSRSLSLGFFLSFFRVSWCSQRSRDGDVQPGRIGAARGGCQLGRGQRSGSMCESRRIPLVCFLFHVLLRPRRFHPFPPRPVAVSYVSDDNLSPSTPRWTCVPQTETGAYRQLSLSTNASQTCATPRLNVSA